MCRSAMHAELSEGLRLVLRLMSHPHICILPIADYWLLLSRFKMYYYFYLVSDGTLPQHVVFTDDSPTYIMT